MKFILFLLSALLVVSSAETGTLRRSSSSEENAVIEQSQGERRLWSFWSLLFMASGCHGPLDKHKPECKTSDSGTDEGGVDGDSDGEDEVTVSEANDSSVSTNQNMSQASGATVISWWMVVVAAVAAVAALAAIMMGQRKEEKDTHKLRGSIAKRMALFSCFAGGCNGARPAHVVDDVEPNEDEDYRLA